jgi:hypothetical protein
MSTAGGAEILGRSESDTKIIPSRGPAGGATPCSAHYAPRASGKSPSDSGHNPDGAYQAKPLAEPPQSPDILSGEFRCFRFFPEPSKLIPARKIANPRARGGIRTAEFLSRRFGRVPGHPGTQPNASGMIRGVGIASRTLGFFQEGPVNDSEARVSFLGAREGEKRIRELQTRAGGS